MIRKMISSFLMVTLCAASIPVFSGEPNPASVPDYFPAVKQELARLGISAQCSDTAASCVLKASAGADGSVFEVVVRYSPATDTILAAIDKFIVFPQGETPPPELALKLLKLNAEMVTAKFEWNAAANSVCLSTVLSCDSNFDRRAFRSQLTGLFKVAQILRAELKL